MPRSIHPTASSKKEKEAKKTEGKLTKNKKSQGSITDKATKPSKDITKKVTSGTNARATKNRLEAFGRLIFARAKAISPKSQLSNKAAYTLSTMLDEVLRQVVETGLEVFSSQGRKTLNASDLFVATRIALPQNLREMALIRSCRVIAGRHGNMSHLETLHEAHVKVPVAVPRFKATSEEGSIPAVDA